MLRSEATTCSCQCLKSGKESRLMRLGTQKSTSDHFLLYHFGGRYNIVCAES